MVTGGKGTGRWGRQLALAGGRPRGGRVDVRAEVRFGTAMNISLAHLFMQYFALAALRRLPLSVVGVPASPLPPRRVDALR